LQVVRQNLWWSAAYNALCVPLALAGCMPAWLAGLGMALSSLMVVLNASRLARNLPMLEAPVESTESHSATGLPVVSISPLESV
jgi:Cu2+-exporting ATPase